MSSKWIVEHTSGHPKAKERRAAARVTQIKSIAEIPQIPMDAWQVATHLFGQEEVQQHHLLASKAAGQMKKAGWTFLEYDPVSGEEIWKPPI